jgi:hypothetical protein
MQKSLFKLGLFAKTYASITWETEAGVLRVQGQAVLHSEIKSGEVAQI